MNTNIEGFGYVILTVLILIWGVILPVNYLVEIVTTHTIQKKQWECTKYSEMKRSFDGSEMYSVCAQYTRIEND